MADKIKVRITGYETVRFNQIKEMTRQEWENLKAVAEDEINEELGEWLDKNDIDDGDGLEDAEAVVVDDDGKPVKPADRILA